MNQNPISFQEQKKSTFKTILTIIKWYLSIVFMIISLISLFKIEIFSFFCLGLIVILIFPPLTKIRNKFKLLRPMVIKIGLITVLFISASISFFSSIKSTLNAKKFQNTKVNGQTTDSIGESINIIERSGIIPNIIPADIYVNFENKGFRTNKEIHSDGSIWTSTKSHKGIDYNVTIYCENGVKDINEIRFMATRSYPQYSTEISMKAFLKFACSTVFYKERDRKLIHDFLDVNFFKKKSEIEINGVKVVLFAPTEFNRHININSL